MVSLTELDVSSNSLEELPIGIGLLRHLRTLYADDNFLTCLPAEVMIALVVYTPGGMFVIFYLLNIVYCT